MSMKTTLEKAVRDIRDIPESSSFDETRTKNGMILPILHSLGWNPSTQMKCILSYSVGSGRVDYSLRTSGHNKVFVEAKRVNQSLASHEEQLLRYAFQEGVSMAVLTNGLAWQLYLPLQQGSWRTRRFYDIDIRRQNPSDIADHLVQFLSRSLIETGVAVRNAELTYTKHRRSSEVQEALSQILGRTYHSARYPLVSLLSDSVANVCGFPPERQQIVDFLAKVRSPLMVERQTEPEFTQPPIPPTPRSGTGK